MKRLPESVSNVRAASDTPTRIPGLPHSTVQKEDPYRKEIVKRPIQQFENHPNRDSLIEDQNKIEEFNPFSETSKELVPAWVTRSTSSFARPLPRYDALIALHIGRRAFFLILHLWQMQPSERNRQLNKADYDVLSIPSYVIQKNPTHGADTDQLCGSTCITRHMKCQRKSRRNNARLFWKGCVTTTNTANLCLILRGLRKVLCNTTKSQWKTIPTLRRKKKDVGTSMRGNSHRTQKLYKDH